MGNYSWSLCLVPCLLITKILKILGLQHVYCRQCKINTELIWGIVAPYGVMNLLNNGSGNTSPRAPCALRAIFAPLGRASESELLLTCPTPSHRTEVNPDRSKCTDWYLWFNVYMIFLSTKVANIGQQGKRYCCLSVFDFIRQIIIRTAQQWQIIDACFRVRTDIADLIGFVGKIC